MTAQVAGGKRRRGVGGERDLISLHFPFFRLPIQSKAKSEKRALQKVVTTVFTDAHANKKLQNRHPKKWWGWGRKDSGKEGKGNLDIFLVFGLSVKFKCSAH